MPPNVVVLGAGYAGLAASTLIAGSNDAAVTLVNERERFVERVRLHQLAAGQPIRDMSVRYLLRDAPAKLVIDRVTRIDPDNRLVHLVETPTPLPYDLLVYALGSGRVDVASVPGVAEHAHTVASIEAAGRLRDRLSQTQGSSGVLVVVGGGATGIEVATELAESWPSQRVCLLADGDVGGWLSEAARAHLRATLARLGVQVHNTRVTEVDDQGVFLHTWEHLAADTVVWATGFVPSTLARDAGIAVDGTGRIRVDATMRSLSHPDIYAAGDAAASMHPNGQQLRMACATAIPTGFAAGQAVIDRLGGKEPAPLRFRYDAQCISLGRDDGVIQSLHGDDSPREQVLTGRSAALVKEAVVSWTIPS